MDGLLGGIIHYMSLYVTICHYTEFAESLCFATFTSLVSFRRCTWQRLSLIGLLGSDPVVLSAGSPSDAERQWEGDLGVASPWTLKVLGKTKTKVMGSPQGIINVTQCDTLTPLSTANWYIYIDMYIYIYWLIDIFLDTQDLWVQMLMLIIAPREKNMDFKWF